MIIDEAEGPPAATEGAAAGAAVSGNTDEPVPITPPLVSAPAPTRLDDAAAAAAAGAVAAQCCNGVIALLPLFCTFCTDWVARRSSSCTSYRRAT